MQMNKTSRVRNRASTEHRIIYKSSFGRIAYGLSCGFLCCFPRISRLIMRELASPVKLPVRHTLRAWRWGLTRFNYRLYGLLQAGNPADYLSDYEAFRTWRINKDFNRVVHNKLAFGLLMKRFGIPTPEILGVIREGVFYPLDSRRAMAPTAFPGKLLEPGERLVLKPISANHGIGLIILAQTENGHQVNGVDMPSYALANTIAKLDHHLVSEFVTQGEYGAKLYPHTVNTIRVMTFWDEEAAEPFVAGAVQRIGTSRSFPVDNFKGGTGGLSASIEDETGKLGPGAMATVDGRVTWHPHHPETHAPIQGVIIPSWLEIRKNVLEYADKFAFAPAIAWDIVPTDSSFSILEGNASAGMPVVQVHEPMLTDPRIKRFYHYHGVIT